ncbi:MAG: Imm8 family immunity protein [Gemmataceae bacterium]
MESNDYPGWEAFLASDVPEPWNHFGWFSLGIGPEGALGTDLFQVCVSTPAAVGRACQAGKPFRGLVVDSFDPNLIQPLLTELVSSTVGNTWEEIVDQLNETMVWEYEGM